MILNILKDMALIILGIALCCVIYMIKDRVNGNNDLTDEEKVSRKEKNDAINRYWRLRRMMVDEIKDLQFSSAWSLFKFSTHARPLITVLEGLLKMLDENCTDNELATKIESIMDTLLTIHDQDSESNLEAHSTILEKKLKELRKDANDYYEARLKNIGIQAEPVVEQKVISDEPTTTEKSSFLDLKKQYKKMEKSTKESNDGDLKDKIAEMIGMVDDIYKNGNQDHRLFSKMETFYLPELVSLLKRYNKLQSLNTEQREKTKDAISMLLVVFEKLHKELTRDENESFELGLKTLQDVAKIDGLIDDFIVK